MKSADRFPTASRSAKPPPDENPSKRNVHSDTAAATRHEIFEVVIELAVITDIAARARIAVAPYVGATTVKLSCARRLAISFMPTECPAEP